jgi:hypothetical protein
MRKTLIRMGKTHINKQNPHPNEQITRLNEQNTQPDRVTLDTGNLPTLAGRCAYRSVVTSGRYFRGVRLATTVSAASGK